MRGECAADAPEVRVSAAGLHHIGFWLARMYAKSGKPADSLKFDSSLVPAAGALPRQTLAQLQKPDAHLR